MCTRSEHNHVQTQQKIRNVQKMRKRVCAKGKIGKNVREYSKNGKKCAKMSKKCAKNAQKCAKKMRKFAHFQWKMRKGLRKISGCRIFRHRVPEVTRSSNLSKSLDKYMHIICAYFWYQLFIFTLISGEKEQMCTQSEHKHVQTQQ